MADQDTNKYYLKPRMEHALHNEGVITYLHGDNGDSVEMTEEQYTPLRDKFYPKGMRGEHVAVPVDAGEPKK